MWIVAKAKLPADCERNIGACAFWLISSHNVCLKKRIPCTSYNYFYIYFKAHFQCSSTIKTLRSFSLRGNKSSNKNL